MTPLVHYLVVSKNTAFRELTRFILEWQFDCVIETCADESEALKYLKTIEVFPHMILYEYESDAFLVEDFIVYVKESQKPVHFLVMAEKIQDTILPHFQNLKHFHLTKKENMLTDILEISRGAFINVIKLNTHAMCRIHFDTLEAIDGIDKDLYIKLPSGKFVKLFESGMIENMDRQKYREKGLVFLWVERSTCQWMVTQIEKQFHIFLANPSFKFILRGPESTKEEAFDQKIIRVCEELHIDPEFKQEITLVMNKIMEVVQKDIKLSKIMQMIQSDDKSVSYFSKNLQLTSFVSCALAKKLEWHSKTTLEKLVYASVLHDITLATKPHLQRLSGLKELEQRKLSEEEKKIYLNHPKEAAQLVKNNFKFAPPETDVLVLQHHELPQGRGFPVAVAAEKLSPLTQLFIVTQDFVRYVMNEEDPSLDMYFLRAETRFEQNVFRKYISILKKLKAGQ
ncbi:MAG: hypothetical protein LW878_13425 [Proteobacteria bacterium]|nr:hypothetical protein [Pseudomonadota bacterium]